MSYFRRLFSVLCVGLTCFAQSPEVSIQEPKPYPVVGWLLKPFHIQPRTVGPAVLSNTPRLESLVRSGNLYLSVQDVIAVTLENNLDIAIQRYAPALAREGLRRTQAGQPLRTVGQSIAPGPQSVSLAGVTSGTVGLPDTGSGVSSGGGLVISLGTQPPSLDPVIFANANFQHQTSPESNLSLVGVPALVTGTQSYNFGYFQNFLTGGFVQAYFAAQRTSLNSPDYVINPFTGGALDLQIQQPLLQGFGIAVNNRFIRIAKNNQKVSDLQLKRQVVTTISAVLNLYWDLVSFNEDVRIRQEALDDGPKTLGGKSTPGGAWNAAEDGSDSCSGRGFVQ